MSYIKTKTGENTITFDAFYQYIWARNYGDTDVYISNHNNIVAGDDDVALLPAGEAVRLTVNGKTLYVLGSTTLEVHAQNFSDSPFAWNEAGEGGGSDVSVVSLSVTENGTYTAPSGTAYSPVTVNVTHPQYVDGGSIISLYNDAGQSVYGFTKTAEIDGVPQLQTVANEACTFECCCNFEPVGSDGRLWEIGNYNNAGTCFAYWTENSTIYASIALHENWYDSAISLDSYIGHRTTFSLVVGDSYTKLYANGTLIAYDIPRSKADLVSNDTDTLYLMHGYFSNRTADGNLYAFRMYHKELTASEIQQNYLADVYNFPNG